MIAAVICDVVARSVVTIALCNCFSLSVNCVTDSIRRGAQARTKQRTNTTHSSKFRKRKRKKEIERTSMQRVVSHTRLRIRTDLIGEIFHDARIAKSTAHTTNPPRTHSHTRSISTDCCFFFVCSFLSKYRNLQVLHSVFLYLFL